MHVNAHRERTRTRRPGARQEGGSRICVISETIDINVPVRTAYNQWTQLVEFPFTASPGSGASARRDEIPPDTSLAG
jgi:hypothetical protein